MAVLVRVFGDIDVAEEAVQDAFTAAVQRWPTTGLPPSPAGFEEGFSAWITGSQLAERLAWARRASAQFGRDEDPREFLKSTLADAARDETIRVVSQAPNKISGLTLLLASPEFNRR